MIAIVPYQPGWPAEFAACGRALRKCLGGLALRIDHIGSTAVPGLAAKDRIDIQVTVSALESKVEDALVRAGYRRREKVDRDHVPPGGPEDSDEWKKWFFREPEGERRMNLHVRVAGRANQRYALLFRDYLRAHGTVAQAYERVKREIARYHSENIEAYCDLKDPVCDIIMAGAEAWAKGMGWEPDPSDA